MIRFVEGNIFDAHTDAIVNTVNLVGVMGKGLALQFKERFKHNYSEYKIACKNGTIAIGHSLVVEEYMQNRRFLIINFPTKNHWRNPSKYEYVEKGLDNLIDIILEYDIKSIAIPPLGAGNGGLDWKRVRQIIIERMSQIECEILVYEPGHVSQSVAKSVSLTPARALMLYILNRVRQEGYDVTTFAAVKGVYFLQKFGATDIFRLKFVPYFYGPYSDAVRHVLHGLDGAYVRGFSDMSKKPFEPFGLIEERISEVVSTVENDRLLSDIANRTCSFLDGNWDDFSLELLSSVDYIMSQSPEDTVGEIYAKLCAWNDRKKQLFSDRQLIESAYKYLSEVDK